MRAGVFAGAVIALLGVSVMIVAGGRAKQTSGAISSQAAPAVAQTPHSMVTAADPFAPVTAPSRMVAPAEVAPPPLNPDQLERVAPREVLSKLSLALPPKPKRPDDWAGTILYRPVATGAGSIEAKGYTIVIAGIDPVAPDEACDADGRSWNCGVRARAAFRAMLRGRAVTCKIPEQADRSAIAAPCRIGKQDLGAWLVTNGWARASAAGPYADQGKKAEADRKGVFGAGPETAAPPPPATSGSTLPAPAIPPAPSIDQPEPLQ